MKKFVVVIGSIWFLTGCSMNSTLDRVPLINDEKTVAENEQKPNEQVKEKPTVNNEKPVETGENLQGKGAKQSLQIQN